MDITNLFRRHSHHSAGGRPNSSACEVCFWNLHQQHRLATGGDCLYCWSCQYKLELRLPRLRHSSRRGSTPTREDDSYCHHGYRCHWFCYELVLFHGHVLLDCRKLFRHWRIVDRSPNPTAVLSSTKSQGGRYCTRVSHHRYRRRLFGGKPYLAKSTLLELRTRSRSSSSPMACSSEQNS